MKPILFCSIPLLVVVGAIQADDVPFMKEGYWSIHTVSTNMPENKKQESDRTICRNHAYEEHVRELSKKSEAMCKTISDTKSGDTKTTETECTIGSTTVHTKGIVTIIGGNAAHTETRATYTPPMHGLSGMTMIMDQKYLGACPAGVEPGDIVGADGKKINSWKH